MVNSAASQNVFFFTQSVSIWFTKRWFDVMKFTKNAFSLDFCHLFLNEKIKLTLLR